MNNQLTPRINNLETNVVIDGGMDFWPQGDSISFPNNTGLYGSSMFKLYNLSTSVTLTHAKSTSSPTTQLASSSSITKTGAGTLAAGSLVQYDYTVEGFDALSIYKEDFSVLFWVKSSVATARSVAVRNSTVSHSFVKTYNINAANTWELKVLKFSSLESSSGITNKDSGVGAFISFPVVGGSTYQTATTNQWISGGFTLATGQDTTWLTGTTHDFFITGVMVLPGDWTAMQSNPASYRFIRAGRNWADEFDMVSRYVEILGGNPNMVLSSGLSLNTTTATGYLAYKVAKRTTPSILFSSVTSFRYNNATNNFTSTNIVAASVNLHTAAFSLTTAGIAAGNIPGTFDTLGTAYVLIDARF